MLQLTALVVAFLLVVPASGTQAPAVSNEQLYTLIDAESTRARLLGKIDVSKVRERLRDAAGRGYRFLFMSSSSRSLNMLLRREAGTPDYLLVSESGERGLINAMNKAAAEGFRVLPESIKALDESSMSSTSTTWVAVLEKRPDAPRVKYSVAKGTREDAGRTLAGAAATGRTLVGVVGREGLLRGNAVLFFEESDGEPRDVPVSQQVAYRVAATVRTSALQSDLAAAAAEGFRVATAGSLLTVVLVREPAAATPKAYEYRVLAALRVATSVKELQAAGAEGFRVVATSENASEAIFIVERQVGASTRFDYEILELHEANANEQLVRAESSGYRIVRLLDDLVVLER